MFDVLTRGWLPVLPCPQAAEAHERLFVSGAGGSGGGPSWAGGSTGGPSWAGGSTGGQWSSGGSEELRWSGSPRPGQSSPPRWPLPAAPAASREEKRHASPVHPADYDDSMDGAPTNKRVRFKPSSFKPSLPSLVPAAAASCSRVASPARGEGEEGEEGDEVEEGYNSEDEYSHVGQTLTEAEWLEKDLRFERVMQRKGYTIKPMGEDGACLFRAVADQLLGDQELHQAVRSQCMDYIEGNADHYSQFVSEPIEEYLARKRAPSCHGNHLEIQVSQPRQGGKNQKFPKEKPLRCSVSTRPLQALSEMYSRPIHIYCYSSEPINIFQVPTNL